MPAERAGVSRGRHQRPQIGSPSEYGTLAPFEALPNSGSFWTFICRAFDLPDRLVMTHLEQGEGGATAFARVRACFKEPHSVGRTREQDEIAVGIKDDEVPCAPGLFLQSLVEAHACGLELQEELLDLRCCVDSDRGRQKVLALANIPDKDWLANKPHAKPRTVAFDHAVKRRVTVDKVDCKPEFGSEEVARRLDVSDVELSFRSAEDRNCRCLLDLSAHGFGSCLERLPSLEPQLASDKLLRVAELKRRLQHLMVIEVPIPRQRSSDLGGNWMIPLTMPAQILLGLLLVFQGSAWARLRSTHRRWALPLRSQPMRPTATVQQCPCRRWIVNGGDISCWGASPMRSERPDR